MKKKLCMLLFVCAALLLFFQLNPSTELLSTPTRLQAEIKGEVVMPGVYEISEDETIEMLIEKAGGVLPSADCSSISLLKRVEHQSVIVIPKLQAHQKISLNTSSKEEIMTLPFIGETRAELILAYRQQHPFRNIEEIMEIKGIGPKTFEKIKDQIAL